ncbi:MAG: hypothetical protein PVG98_05140 [Chromatiales bacterium]|jgi:hypothetical protein
MSGAGRGERERDLEIAERVRRACVAAALETYELSGIQGLCADGRWEAAIGAIRTLDLRGVLKAVEGPDAGPRQG